MSKCVYLLHTLLFYYTHIDTFIYIKCDECMYTSVCVCVYVCVCMYHRDTTNEQAPLLRIYVFIRVYT